MTTTYFIKENNLATLKEWFEANATEYFGGRWVFICIG